MTPTIDTTNDIPEDVRAAMRDLLGEAMQVARTCEPPDDGDLHQFRSRRIGEGMYLGGWDLQAVLLRDDRIRPGPHVIVSAYREATPRGSVGCPMVWTPADRRVLAEKRLAWMVEERGRLDARIEELRRELEVST